MTLNFLWSKNNPKALENICPKLGMREWNDLSNIEKETIFTHFSNRNWFIISFNVFDAVYQINKKYVRIVYGKKLFTHGGPHFFPSSSRIENCCLKFGVEDFYRIFTEENQDVVFEMISFYVLTLIEKTHLFHEAEKTSDEDHKNALLNEIFYKFDCFSALFNEIFEQFSINAMLTRNGIVLRQDPKITEEVYVPVLNYLSDKKWEPVNRDLADAFKKFMQKTPSGYSGCITNGISALQGFLQILVEGKTGKGNIEKLIERAKKNGLIPNDPFSSKIFNDFESILTQERHKTGDPHPKQEYANEKTARMVLNLIMIFIQHCITK